MRQGINFREHLNVRHYGEDLIPSSLKSPAEAFRVRLDEASTSEQVHRLMYGENQEYPDHVQLLPVGSARR